MSSVNRRPLAFFFGCFFGLAAAVFVTACSEDKTESFVSSCERSPALLVEARTCLLDEDCPCGTSCSLGACTAECSTDEACSGEHVCDDFGRCTDPATANVPRALNGLQNGLIFVDRNLVELLEQDSVVPARIQARFRPLSAVRVSARTVEVACGDQEAFGSECRFENVAPGQSPRAIRIRSVGTRAADDAQGEVFVHAEGQRHVIGVRIVGRTPPPPVARVGVYEGVARLVGAGLRARTVADTLPEQLKRLTLPVRFEVFDEVGGIFAVRMHEARGAVFPQGSVGQFALTPSRQWNLQVVARPLLTGDADDPRAVQVHAFGEMNDATFRDGLLDGDFITVLEGLAPLAQAPFVRWRISATRVADLPADATRPQMPADPAAIDVRSRAETPLPEELALRINPGFTLNAGASGAIQALCYPASTELSVAQDRRGDLRCLDGRPMRAFGIGQGALSLRANFLASCENAMGPTTSAPRLVDIHQSGDCLDRARAVFALASAAAVDRDRAFGTGEPDEQSSRLALRLAQQWVSLQAFVGIEPSRVYRLATVAPEGPSLQALSAYGTSDALVRALQTSIAGWDLLLHPRISAALVATPPSLLRTPDYRPSFGASGVGGEAVVGLPVSMLYTLTSQIDGLNAIIEELRFGRSPDDLDRRLQEQLRAFFPRSAVVFALAQGLYDAARSDGLPAWDREWTVAREQYGVSVNRMPVEQGSGRWPVPADLRAPVERRTPRRNDPSCPADLRGDTAADRFRRHRVD
ncbi:MAG: hypothetical protein AAF449_14535 [Myxococcota bacterium]